LRAAVETDDCGTYDELIFCLSCVDAFSGFNIGFLANCILRLKHEAAPILAARHGDRVSCSASSGFSSVAVIFRSNENLMEYAIQGERLQTLHHIFT
jgi:hypothetical protein